MAHETPFNDFGLIIAYVLPGFMVVWGVSLVYPPIGMWLAAPASQAPSVAGFLYATVASIAAGLTVSTVRWLLVDTVHHLTGVHRPNWNFAQLGSRVAAYQMLIRIHYDYYKFHANMLVSVACVYSLWRYAHPRGFGIADAGFIVLSIILFLGSRDNLRKYYERTGQLLGDRKKESRRKRGR